MASSAVPVADASSQRHQRVAHVVLSLQPGGLERIVCDLVRSALRQGGDVLVCCLDEEGALAPSLMREGGRVVVVKRRPGSDPALVLRLAAFFRQEQVDVVHTHSLDPMLYAGLAARLAGIRCLIHSQHDVMLRTYGRGQRLKFRIAAPLFTRTVGVSAETSLTLRERGVPGDQAATVLNGVDVRRFDRDRASIDPAVAAGWPAEPGTFVIGTVARLSPEKGLDRLIAAFERLTSRVSNARLVIVGDGPERERLEALAMKFKPGVVRFLGRQERVEHILPRFDVFALASLTEGIPVAVLEAMAASRPVVATRVGGVPEVISDGISGVLVAPDDPDALASALEALALDPARRESLARAGRTRVAERFSLDAMASNYDALYATGGESLFGRMVKRHVLGRMPRSFLAWRAVSRRPHVALTFDDGPHPDYTPRLLDILRQRRVRSTFFLIGQRAEEHPALVERIISDGHEVANHSWTHPQFEQLRWSEAMSEIGRTERLLAPATTRSRGLFRPPRGKLCAASLVGPWLKRLTVVMWNVDLKDFRASSAREITAPLEWRPLTAGDIVLYHGHSEAALEALPAVIDHALARQLSCVRVSSLLWPET
jgi:glycosyltransferase involved in cell wall biosynthesis